MTWEMLRLNLGIDMTNQDTLIDYNKLKIRYFPSVDKKSARFIFDFFMVFSRFEFALKKIGYYKTYSNNRVSPDWNSFAKDYENIFNPNKSEELFQAVSYYLSHPPWIQVLNDDKLEWRENTRKYNESDFAWIIRSIRVTRNNLFHGGKFPWLQYHDKKLLYYGLVILYECLELNEGLFQVFNTSS